MGGNFSTRHDVYLQQFVNPLVQEAVHRLSIRVQAKADGRLVIVGTENPFARIVSDKDLAQSAIITGIFLLHLRNEVTDAPVEIVVHGLFVGKNQNQNVPHTDDTGELRIMCPAGFDDVVTGNDQILYKPRLRDEVVRAYAGLDEAFMNEEATTLPENHPIVHFVSTNAKHLELQSRDFTHNPTSKTYDLNPEFLAKVKRFYANTIHEDMHPTRFEGTYVDCRTTALPPAPGTSVMCVIQVNTLIVTPGEPRMRVLEVRK